MSQALSQINGLPTVLFNLKITPRHWYYYCYFAEEENPRRKEVASETKSTQLQVWGCFFLSPGAPSGFMFHETPWVWLPGSNTHWKTFFNPGSWSLGPDHDGPDPRSPGKTPESL